jgi:uncharacterized protein YqjF (DUF2071 family)
MSSTPIFLDRFMSQRWEDLVLFHYEADPKVVQGSLPGDLTTDLCQGKAWLSVVAFRLTSLRIRPLTWLRWSDFWEVNLRTYVRHKDGRRGVWFYSLDSTDPFGVIGARMLYGLNYNFARIRRDGASGDGSMQYFSKCRGGEESMILAQWGPKGVPRVSSDELDHFLLERYRFWAKRRWASSCSSAAVRHQPYETVPLSKAHYQGDLFSSQGFGEPTAGPARAHYCPGFSVEATAPSWMLSISGQVNQR